MDDLKLDIVKYVIENPIKVQNIKHDDIFHYTFSVGNLLASLYTSSFDKCFILDDALVLDGGNKDKKLFDMLYLFIRELKDKREKIGRENELAELKRKLYEEN